MSAVQVSRLAELAKLRCNIFQTSYNPTQSRTGSKYLKAALKGPKMATYYDVMKPVPFKAFSAMFPDLKLLNLKEEQRLVDLENRKRRGKGTPKKGEGKKAVNRKKK